MSLLLYIIVTYIKENIITKLQKLYSPPRNPSAGNKFPALFVKKTSLHRRFIARVQNIHWKACTKYWDYLTGFGRFYTLDLDFKNIWTNLLDSYLIYHTQTGTLLEKHENYLLSNK